jgi:hypothetical protein
MISVFVIATSAKSQKPLRNQGFETMVAGAGIEPATQGFSVLETIDFRTLEIRRKNSFCPLFTMVLQLLCLFMSSLDRT